MPTTKWCRTFIDVRQSALDLEPEDATDLTAQQFRYGGWVLAAKQPVLICCGLALASARGLTLPGFRSAEIRQTAISESAITIHALPKPAASNADDLFFNLAVPPLPRDKLELVSTVPSTRPRLRLVWHWQSSPSFACRRSPTSATRWPQPPPPCASNTLENRWSCAF